MAHPQWNERFFASTRGQVVLLLRGGATTVADLASALALTDNAVRAHLAALERDGLVRQGPPRRGTSKPAFTYHLTPAADRLFPHAYGLLLWHFIDVLAKQVPPDQLVSALRQVGSRLAAGYAAPTGNLSERVAGAVDVLHELGGITDAESSEEGFVIQGRDCPFAAAASGHPVVCQLGEALLSDYLGVTVTAECETSGEPHCRFVVRTSS